MFFFFLTKNLNAYTSLFKFSVFSGFQSRKVSCVKRRMDKEVDEKLCDPMLKPTDTQACGGDPCPPQWVETDWTPCSKHCGEGGEQTRTIKCEQIVNNGIPTVVDENQCINRLGPKNVTKKSCNKDVECPNFHLGPWKPVSDGIIPKKIVFKF